MAEDEPDFTELYSHHGVLVQEIEPNIDIDFRHNLGTLAIVKYNSDLDICIEWHQCRVSIESDYQEWAIVNDAKCHTEENPNSSKKPVIQMKGAELAHVNTSRNRQKLTISDNETEITFYFQNGNADKFVSFLKGIFKSTMLQRSSNSFVLTNQKDAHNLDKSFTELDIFTDDTTRSNVLWNFMKRFHDNRYYEATMDTFCKVTNTFAYRPQYQSDEEVPVLLNRSIAIDDLNDVHNGKVSNEDYEVIPKSTPLPPRTLPPRRPPLTTEQWANAFDEYGRVTSPDMIKDIVFHGGIKSGCGLRKEVWKYLLDYYPWESTAEERELLRKQKSEEYYIMKLQWKSLTQSQIERFSAYKERKSLIEKDVHRTDRNLEFFAGDDNPNLAILQNILMAYVMYNFDLGYVQGMSDLLSPLLVQIEDEVDTFWCFVGFMNRVSRNFELDQEGMKVQFQQLHCLLGSVEPELSNYLDHHDSKNMSFCFRWLLVWFKREFCYDDIYLLWEVLWTEFICKNYHLLICAAILENEKETIMSNNYGFTEILKHVNELSYQMNVELILRKAEGIYIQLSTAGNILPTVRQIIGLSPTGEIDLTEIGIVNRVNEEKAKKHEVNGSTKSSFSEDNGEIAFDQSLSLQYL